MRAWSSPSAVSDAGLARALTTGIWTNGSPLRPPMQFRMSSTDIEAVIAHLKLLNHRPYAEEI